MFMPRSLVVIQFWKRYGFLMYRMTMFYQDNNWVIRGMAMMPMVIILVQNIQFFRLHILMQAGNWHIYQSKSRGLLLQNMGILLTYLVNRMKPLREMPLKASHLIFPVLMTMPPVPLPVLMFQKDRLTTLQCTQKILMVMDCTKLLLIQKVFL